MCQTKDIAVLNISNTHYHLHHATCYYKQSMCKYLSRRTDTVVKYISRPVYLLWKLWFIEEIYFFFLMPNGLFFCILLHSCKSVSLNTLTEWSIHCSSDILLFNFFLCLYFHLSSLKSVGMFIESNMTPTPASYYFELSQPQRITSGLKTNFSLLPTTLHTSHQTTDSPKPTKPVLTNLYKTCIKNKTQHF